MSGLRQSVQPLRICAEEVTGGRIAVVRYREPVCRAFKRVTLCQVWKYVLGRDLCVVLRSARTGLKIESRPNDCMKVSVFCNEEVLGQEEGAAF